MNGSARLRAVLAWAAACASLIAASPAAAQHGTGLHLGAEATGLTTHATPAVNGESATEAYLTRPVVHGMWTSSRGRFGATGMLNLEGWTLDRGELNAGVWGEGYVDRRHPHTFLHELVVHATTSLAGVDGSFSAGRGFAPFGTDDPMVRPFVKYPANHHLAQILERWVAIAAVRRGPATIEVGTFNGDEPVDPASLGEIDRFGDSWAARATVVPLPWLETQVSHAFVASPEHAAGGGLDHRKWSASARAETTRADIDLYGLFEWARTDEYSSGRRLYAFSSWLGEGAAGRGPWRAAARWERTTRPEEERLADPFRTMRPHADENILGATRWIAVTGRVERSFETRGLVATPFVEASRVTVTELTGAIFSPRDFYGEETMWGFSAGLSLRIGDPMRRMGRYGIGGREVH